MPKSTDYRTLIQKFSHLFREAPDLTLENMEEQAIVKITLYFKPCYYGETRLRVKEWFNSDDEKVQYRYSWEKNRTKPGHISAWENEFHEVPHHQFPDGMATDPHHHHHVPADRSQVQENYTIHDLDKVLEVIGPFIENGKSYDGKKL